MDRPHDGHRNYYRIRYPEAARPQLWVRLRCFEVTELSEQGLRILAIPTDVPHDEPIQGTLKLYCRQTRDIQGRYDRYDPPELVLARVCGISYPDILAEQRALIRDFPDFRG